jgi:hypothetical protein
VIADGLFWVLFVNPQDGGCGKGFRVLGVDAEELANLEWFATARVLTM